MCRQNILQYYCRTRKNFRKKAQRTHSKEQRQIWGAFLPKSNYDLFRQYTDRPPPITQDKKNTKPLLLGSRAGGTYKKEDSTRQEKKEGSTYGNSVNKDITLTTIIQRTHQPAATRHPLLLMRVLQIDTQNTLMHDAQQQQQKLFKSASKRQGKQPPPRPRTLR
eukprot:TRINITY_DN1067_c0_g1_i1.p1 TRINITY_DN1067_c0_g1~~TRINITY_DN1067_c0_g1_i1.p1  ORF type:complete len:164 (+),score=32.52 TRINITY_DN1067_c0_g1_i1:246-737(+)